MAIPVLQDYEYQYREDGVLLNGSTSLPFVDVESIQGLDMAEIDINEVDVDGTHGGVITGDFFKARTIVIDGTAYANPATAEVYMDSLIKNFLPHGEYPFFFKGPGVAQRFINCKPAGFKYNVDTLRRTGQTKIQIILKAGDPRKYVETVDTTFVDGTYKTVNNTGNVITTPVFTLTGGTQSGTSFRNNTTGRQITISRAMVASDIMTVDLGSRMVYINGIRNSSVLGTGVVTWWGLNPGNNSIRFWTSGATGYVKPTGTVTWRSGWA